jgi:hypothetical protein
VFMPFFPKTRLKLQKTSSKKILGVSSASAALLIIGFLGTLLGGWVASVVLLIFLGSFNFAANKLEVIDSFFEDWYESVPSWFHFGLIVGAVACSPMLIKHIVYGKPDTTGPGK